MDAHCRSDQEAPNAILEDLGAGARGFLDALGRLYVNCTVYLPQHPQIVTACQGLHACITPLLQGQEKLTVRTQGDGRVQVGSLHVPDLGPQGQRLIKDLDLLGIECIEMDPAMDAAEFLTLCQTLREAAATSVRHNGSPDEHLQKLRGPVRVRQRDYGMPTFSPDEAAGTGMHHQLVEEVLKPLAGVSLDSSTREHLLRFIGQVLSAAQSRQGPKEAQEGGPPQPQGALSRDDLAAVAALQLRRLIETHIDRNQGLKDLHVLFNEFESTLSLSAGDTAARFLAAEIRDTTEVLLKNHFQSQPSPDCPGQPPPRAESPDLRDDVAEIQELLRAHRLPGNLLITDHREYLGILFQTLLRHRELSLDAVRQRLERVLSQSLPEPAQRVLEEATAELCRRGVVATLDAVLPALSASLRLSDPCCPGRILREACRTGTAATLAAVWPHVANEVLLGIPDSDERLHEDLCALLAQQPLEGMRQEAGRLATVRAIAERAYAPPAFHPARGELYPLYLVLLSFSDLMPLWKLLLHGLRMNPPPTAAGAAVMALGRLDFNERRFLGEVLREAHERRSSDALRVEAAAYLVRALRALGPDERGASWVVPAIKALGKLRCPQAEQMLDEIERTRTRLLRHQWPAACRGAVQASRLAPSRR